MNDIVLQRFNHAEGFVRGVPSCPSFHVRDFSMIVENENGRITLQGVGSGPKIQDLKGFYLVVTQRGRSLSFGLAHNLWVNGDLAPFCEVFQVPSNSDVAGLSREMGYIDLCLASKKGAADSDHFYTFTFIDWEEMMNPPAWRKRISGVSEEDLF